MKITKNKIIETTFRIAFSIIYILSLFVPVETASAAWLPAQMNLSFLPIQIGLGGISRLDITIYNPNATTLTNAAFTNNLIGIQPGLYIATPANMTNSCGGTATAVAGATTLSLVGGTVPAQVATIAGTCTISVDISSITSGNLINTIISGALTDAELISNLNPGSATLQVKSIIAPSLSKSFTPLTTIMGGQTTQLSVVIRNNDAATPLTGTSITDLFPANVILANPVSPNLVGCGAGTLTNTGGGALTAGGTAIKLNNGTIAVNSTCTLTVNVTSNIAGTYINTLAANSITTGQGVSNSTAASATLAVQRTVSIIKAFVPTTINAGGTSTLTITLQNPTGSAYTGAAFTDALPTGLTISGTPTTTCVGGNTASSTATSIVFSGGTIPASATPTTPPVVYGTCTVTATVTTPTSTSTGAYPNTIPAGGLTTTQGINSTAAANATLNVNAISVAKAFSVTTNVPAGGTSILTVTLTNPTGFAYTGTTFTDTMPAGLTISGTPTTTCASGVLTTSDTTHIRLTGATVPANGTCTITANTVVPLNAPAAATYANTIPIGGVTTIQGATNQAAANASITSIVTTTVVKAFLPTSFPDGGTSTLTITLRNPTGTALTNTAISDTVPSPLTVVPGSAATTCGGTATTTAPNIVSLTGGTIPASISPPAPVGSCTITVQVTAPLSASTATLTNTIPANALTNTQGTTNATAATATITNQSVSVAKAFSVATVATGDVSTLTITLNNPTGSPYTVTTISDVLPSPLTVVLGSATTTCTGGVATTTAPRTVTLTGGTIPPSATPPTPVGTCTITVDFTTPLNAAPGTYANTLNPNALTTTQGAQSKNTATANVTVQSATVAKAFSPAAMPQGGTSTLTITITNPGNTDYTNASIADTLPGTVLSYVGGTAVTDCGAGALAITLPRTITMTGGTIPANGSCTITVDVTSPSVMATTTNTIPIGALTTTQLVTNTVAATAPITVSNTAVTLAKQFRDTGNGGAIASITPGADFIIRLTITSPGDGTTLTNFSITDNLPAGMTINNPPAPTLGAGCGAATPTAVNGASVFSMTGATIVSGTTCRITVHAVSNSAGTYVNTVNPTDVTNTEGRPLASPVSATLAVNGNFTMSKAFYPDTINPNGVSTLTVTLTNTSASPMVNVSLTDPLPTLGGLVANQTWIAPTPAATTTCTGNPALTLTADAGTTSFSMTGGTIPAKVGGVNGICTISVNVQGRGALGARNNSIPTANVSGYAEGFPSTVIRPTNPANATLTIGTVSVTIVKGILPTIVTGGSNSVLSILLTNPTAVTLSNVGFVDTMHDALLNKDLFITNPTNFSTGTCGGTLSGTSGTNVITYSGGTLLANASCTLTVSITIDENLTITNTIPAGAVTTINGATNAALTSASLTSLPGVSVSKFFAPNPVLVGAGNYSLLTIKIKNTSNAALTGLGISDTLPIGLTILASPAPVNNCGGALTATAGTQLIQLVGGNIAGSIGTATTCTIVISVNSATPGSYQNCIPANAITDIEGATNDTAACDTLSVLEPDLSVTKGNNVSGTVLIDGSFRWTLSVSNTTGPLVGNAIFQSGQRIITDNLPVGPTYGSVVVTNGAIPPTGTGTISCSVVANVLECVASGGTVILPKGGSFSFYVNVEPATVGALINPSGGSCQVDPDALITESSEANNSCTPNTVTVLTNTPSIIKSFAPNPVLAGVSSVLTFIISNPSSAYAQTSVAFTDALPSLPGQMEVAATPGIVLTGCGSPTFAPAAGDTSLTFSGGTIVASGSCTVKVNVVAPKPGAYNNLSGNVSSNTGVGNTASATLNVNANPPSINKAFLPTTILAGETSTITFTITNPSATVTQPNLTFTDTFPAGMVVASTPNVTVSPSCGALASTPAVAVGDTSITMSSGALATSAVCTVTVNVTSSTTGANNNSTYSVASDRGTNVGASRTLQVNINRLTITKAFNPTSVLAGGMSALTFTITAPSLSTVLPLATHTAVTFTDTFPVTPGAMVVASTPGATTTNCGTPTFAPVAGAASVTMTGGTVVPGTPCVVTVNVTAPVVGTYNNGTNPSDYPVSSNFGAGNTPLTVPLSAVAQTLTMTKTAEPTSASALNPGDTVTYAVTVTNTNPIMQTAIVLNDPLPTGTTYVIPNNTVATAPAFYADSFDSVLYSNTYGTLTWTPAWSEDATDDNNAATGDINITAETGNNRLHLQNSNNSASRVVNLSGYTSATLTFDRKIVSLEAGEQFFLDVSNGTTWTNGFTWTGAINNTTYITETLDLTPYINAGTAIRFRSGNTLNTTDDIYLDNIAITTNGTVTKDNIAGGTYPDLTNGTPATLVTATDNFSLLTGQSMTVTYQVTVNDPNSLASIVNTASVRSTQQTAALTATVTHPTARSTVGSTVWLDENGNGKQDAGEAGIPNATVTLTGTDADGNAVNLTTTTDVNGNYLFTGLAASNGSGYAVTVDSASLPAGIAANPTYDEDGTTGSGAGTPNLTMLVLGSSTAHLTANFGYNWSSTTETNTNTGTGSIGDRVWIDANSNGIQDAGEAGLGGVTVNLVTAGADGIFGTADDVTAATTTTNVAGNYFFDGLAAGAYQVSIPTTPAGYTQTGDPDHFGAGGGTNDNKTTAPIIIAPGDVFANADFGYNPSGATNTIGNQIFVDTNGDGLGAGEPGISGVTVSLKSGTTVIATTVTNSLGQYSFPGLPDGTYTVWVNDTANMLGNLTQTSTPNNLANGGQACGTCNGTNSVTVTGADNAFQDFGYAPANHGGTDGLIGDTIFLDADGSGAFNAGDTLLAGVTVRLYNAAGTMIASTVTNQNGQYFFGNLPDATYTVKVTAPAGYTNTADPQGAIDNQSIVTISAGSRINLAQDFGYQGTGTTGTIGNLIWNDLNADGVKDAGESGIDGVTVALYRDKNGNGTLDEGDALVGTTTTTGGGAYSFGGLSTDDGGGNAQYLVNVTDTGGKLFGMWASSGAANTDNNSQADLYPVTLTAASATNNTADFGYYNSSATIGDFVWSDTNGDGIKDTGELGISGATVTLLIHYANGTDVTLKTTTDTSGAYLFDKLLIDDNFGTQPTFTVSVATPLGYATVPIHAGGDTTKDSGDTTGETVTPVKGSSDLTIDFGFTPLPKNFGHLPSSYIGTNLIADGGAYHLTDTATDSTPATATHLGASAPIEADGLNPAKFVVEAADNGVTLPTTPWKYGLANGGNGGSVTTTITCTSNPCYISGWIDWNGDGDFNDANENIIVNQSVSGGTTPTFTFDIPGGTAGNLVTNLTSGFFARFRLYAADPGTATPNGPALNGGILTAGEVEDYQIAVQGGVAKSTPITVAYFRAQRLGTTVNLDWSTSTETGNIGFNLYVESSDGQLKQINAELIPSKVIDSLDRQDYSFSATVKGTNFYIEDVSVLGETRQHGPFKIGEKYGDRLDADKIDQDAIQAEHDKKQADQQEQLKQDITVPGIGQIAAAKPKATKPAANCKYSHNHACKPITATPVVTATPCRKRTCLPTAIATTAIPKTAVPTTAVPATTQPVATESTATPEPATETPTATPVPTAATEVPTETPVPTEATEAPTATPAPTEVGPVDPNTLQLTTTLNLKVRQTGMYRVTYEILRDAGLDLVGTSAANIILINRGKVTPAYVAAQSGIFEAGSYIEFYGEALDTIYTDANIYTVQVSNAPVVSMQSDNTAPDLTLDSPVSYTETVTVNNQRNFSRTSPSVDAWYDTYLLAYTTPKSYSFDFQVNRLVDPSAAAALELTVWGATKSNHHLLVSINGVPLANQTFADLAEQVIKVALPAGTLHEGANSLQLTMAGDMGVAYDLVYLDKFNIAYQRAFQATNGALTFIAAGDAFNITNLPNANVSVYRMNDAGLTRIENVSVNASGTTFTAAFAGSSKPATYIISAAALTPILEATRLKADLNSPAQYLIISHPDFINGLQPLIQARQAQGLTVSVVNVNDLYAQYNDGIFDPSAIKKYVAYAAENLGTQYVLLVGGDTYDYRNFTGKNSISFIPSIYVTTGEIAKFVPVDPAYADINLDNIPDIAIGRFPVRNSSELNMMITKTLAYANKNYGRTAVFASDINDGALSFKDISNRIAAGLPNGWATTNIHLNDALIADARLQLKAAMNNGTALVTYTGHSGPDKWAASGLFNMTDAAALTNIGRPFALVQWGCWNTYYVDPANNYLVQKFLFSGNQGAAAVFGSVTLTDSESERLLGIQLMPRLTAPGTPMGQALLDAKIELAKTHPELLDVLLGWTLMGDPALVVEP